MTTVQPKHARRLRKGFTLLEILITIAIMALLVGVVVGNEDMDRTLVHGTAVS